MFIKLGYTNRPGEFAVNVETILLMEPLNYSDMGEEYEGTMIHLEGGKQVESSFDIDSILKLIVE
jgi:hypothetical protein